MTDLLVLACLAIGYGLISGRTQGTPLTGPIVFVTVGLGLGTVGMGLLTGTAVEPVVRILAESTLVFVLFTDAVRIELPVLRREYGFPLRLLGIGMPLVIVGGTLAALALFPELEFWEAAVLAAVLAPTDAALVAAVIADRRLPERIRQSLNVESGLNDGIALPIVMVLLALAASVEGDIGSTAWWFGFAARQIGLGVLVGVAVGAGGGWLLAKGAAAGWISPDYLRLVVLGLAVLAYTGAETVTGNGFVAAFVAGSSFGTLARPHAPHVHDFVEREGRLLSMLTFTLFAAVIIGPRLEEIDWRVLAYAVVSLVVVRPLAVVIAMTAARLRWETRLFLGWFGPRGLASILFALLVVEQSGIANADEILLVTSTTVLLSVYAHGISAAPWGGGFARRAAGFASSAPERLPVPRHRTR
ncbi:cation:proton antiporter [Salinactinospora qingdaonensis]|uniref:Cation:proton antiporter n=1 Tax=Salinactinospora qingdaonensis TaxID=702744 RepID=A0ABP7GI82_9ACTN